MCVYCVMCVFQCAAGRCSCDGVVGAGSSVPSSGAAALSAAEVRPHWSVLQEAPRRREGEQRDHGAGDVCLRLPPALGQLLDGLYWLSPGILSSIHKVFGFKSGNISYLNLN